MITIETRLKDASLWPLLERNAALFSRLERVLFVALYVKREPLLKAQSRFITEHQVTARQFNAIRVPLEARIESWRECRLLNLVTVEKQIAKTEHAILTKLSHFGIHQKNRRLRLLLDRTAKIEAELASPVPAICFGSKKVFHQQFALTANGYKDHAAWRADWQAHRASQFYVLGSADESAGNQSCQFREDVLHLRLPDALGGQTLCIPVDFTYRKEALLAALTPTKQQLTRGPRKGTAVERCSAVSYRFLRRANGRWYVQAMFDAVSAPVVTDPKGGAFGVDLNPWGAAVTRLDPSGNPVESLRFPWLVEGRRDDQIRATIGDTVKLIVAYALRHKLPIVIEGLDFTAKKAGDSAKLNRMISAFAYAAFAQIMRGRCARSGVGLASCKAAYTSVIGAAKFGGGYGLSIHNAAAAAIARRALNFGEKLCVRQSRYAHLLPVRNRKRHVWSDWSQYAKAVRARRAAERKGRSLTPAQAEALMASIPVPRLRSDGAISSGGMRISGCKPQRPTARWSSSDNPAATNAVRVAS